MINKRSFLVGAAGAGSLGPASQAIATPGARVAPMPQLPGLGEMPGLQRWQAYLHQPFELDDGHQCWTVQLSQITRLALPPGGRPSEQFVLGFVNTSPADIPTGTHRLRHADGAQAMVFLSGLRGQGAQTLRAEYNLLQAAA